MRFQHSPVLALLLLAAACGGQQEANGEGTAADSAVWVGKENVVVAELDTLVSGPTIAGTLEAERQATIRAEVAGQVLALEVEPGQPVQAGQVLARLEDAGIRDAYESARAAVRSAELAAELARRNRARSAELAQAGAIPERDLETADLQAQSAEAQLLDAQARLASAEKALGKTVIRAPFRGVISERSARVGDIVQSGAVLFTLVDPGSLKYEGTVPVESRAGLTVGAPVRFTVGGAGAEEVAGRVSRINPAVDPATRQIRVTVQVPNKGNELLAGLFAEGRVATATREGVVVPSGAIDRRGLRPYVVRVNGGRTERVEVELGLIDQAGERTEVTTGLAAGDTLLVGGAAGLPSGTPVRIGSPAELRASSAARPAGAGKD